MIFLPETYGNPQNPFNEQLEPLEIEWRVISEPTRALTRQHIKIMQSRSDKVEVNQFSYDGFTRQLKFNSRAPFAQSLNMFVNEAMWNLREGIPDSVVSGLARITIGDTYVNSQVRSRWMVLENSENQPFAVSGISSPRQDGRYQEWHSLVVVVDHTADRLPEIQIWGHEVGNEFMTALPETEELNFDSHYEALLRALSSQVEKIK